MEAGPGPKPRGHDDAGVLAAGTADVAAAFVPPPVAVAVADVVGVVASTIGCCRHWLAKGHVPLLMCILTSTDLLRPSASKVTGPGGKLTS